MLQHLVRHWIRFSSAQVQSRPIENIVEKGVGRSARQGYRPPPTFEERRAYRRLCLIRQRRQLVQQVQYRVPPKFQLTDLRFALTRSAREAKDNGRPFDSMSIKASLRIALSEMGCVKPTAIQRDAIPILLKSHAPHLLAAETGSGKTLAYLVPLLQHLADGNVSPAVKTNKAIAPRALILVPSRELTDQVLQVVMQLSKYLSNFRAASWNLLEHQPRRSLMELASLDLLIATPVSMKNAIDRNLVQLSRLSHVVIDEADTLMTADFGEATASLFKSLQSTSCQWTLATATIPKTLTRALSVHLNKPIVTLSTTGVHRPAPGLSQHFVNVTDPGNGRSSLLVSLMERYPHHVMLIFCNNRVRAEALFRYLNTEYASKLGPFGVLHGNQTESQRANVLSRFYRGEWKRLICTDLASRGLDTTNVHHVVLYDFPRNAIDYLHRVGRTGRLGKRGRVTAFVGRRDRLLANYIQLAIRRHVSFCHLNALVPGMKAKSAVTEQDGNPKSRISAIRRPLNSFDLMKKRRKIGRF